jgi:hypothetical protein
VPTSGRDEVRDEGGDFVHTDSVRTKWAISVEQAASARSAVTMRDRSKPMGGLIQ